ncbi:MAG: hypothetical protein J5546_07390 [Lachnospiraceae bacterium]|nr:hypothetical protein [Lachnospiraceae bacterium]
MKKFLLYSVAAFLLAFSSCVTTKIYLGPKQDPSSLATIIQANNILIINDKETSESAQLIEVDGILLKGHPKHCEVLPGNHTVEIRHFQKWNDNENKQILKAILLIQAAASIVLVTINHEDINELISNAIAGTILGAIPGFFIGKRIAQDNDTHQHYLVSFDTEAGKAYTIMAVTDPETFETSVYVINAETEEIIESDIELIE